MTLFFGIWKSCLNLLPYSVGRKSVIIAGKLMKFPGHLAYVVLIKGCWRTRYLMDSFFLTADWKLEKKQRLCLVPVLYCSTMTKWVDQQRNCEPLAVIVHIVCTNKQLVWLYHVYRCIMVIWKWKKPHFYVLTTTFKALYGHVC